MVTTRTKAASATRDPKTPNPDPNTRNSQTPFSTSTIISPTIKSVFLTDWWLVKAKAKGLAVGGFSSKDGLGVRVFSSAAISKRHSASDIESEDGIMITVCGLLNRSRTRQNGFPPELYNQFVIGFPFDWEEYAAVVLGEDSDINMPLGNNESNSLPFPLDDIPVTKARDVMLSSFGDSDYCSRVEKVFSDILTTSWDDFEHTGSSINLNMEYSFPVGSVDSGTTETPTKQKKVTVQDDKNMITEETTNDSQKSGRPWRAPTSNEGVSTRSMTTKSVSTRNMTQCVSTRSVTRSTISKSSMTRRKLSPTSFPVRGYREQGLEGRKSQNIKSLAEEFEMICKTAARI